MNLAAARDDAEVLASLSLGPGLEGSAEDAPASASSSGSRNCARPELSLAWPLRHFASLPASSRCTRLTATLLRFLHYHGLCSKRGARGGPSMTPRPRVHLDLPPQFPDEEESTATAAAFFAENVRAACALLGRPLSVSCTGAENLLSSHRLESSEESATSTRPISVIISFFPYPDEERAVALKTWAAQQLVSSSSSSANADKEQLATITSSRRGMLFVVCGDCEALGVPSSSAEEEERGLDALRVEMLLKKHLSPAFTSGAAIAVEYARGGSDGARAREENCRLRRQQRAQLVRGDQELLLLCEKWLVFVAREQIDADCKTSHTSQLHHDNNGARVVTGLGGGGIDPAAAEVAAAVSRPSAAAVARLRSRLHDWILARLERWDAAQGNAKLKLEQKYGTRDKFEKHTCLAAALRFERRTGFSDLFAMQSEDK